MKKIIATSLTLLTFAAFEQVKAASATSGFALRVSVASTCQVNASDIDFGKITDFTSNNDASGTIKVVCSSGLPFEIGIDQGSFGKSTSERMMQNQSGTSEMLKYQIFTDPSRTRNWGNTVGKDTYADKGTGEWSGYTVYTRIPSQPTVGAGEYVDKVQITITY
jgi:spore coat protein U-like protein